MRYTLIPAIAAGCLFATASLAGDVRALTDVQLDNVSAGAFASTFGASNTFGDLLSETESLSSAVAIAGVSAVAQNNTTGIATSTFYGAQSTSESTSAATLP